VARINGLVHGTLDGSSFTLSQAFYIGGITGRPRPTVIVTPGRPIDLCDHLDAGAIFKNGRNAPSEWFQPQPLLEDDLTESDDDPLLLAECRWRVANFTEAEGIGHDPGGGRAFQLVNWLGDLSTCDGKTPSEQMIRTVIRDLYPNTKIPLIRQMLARRHEPRGWDILPDPNIDPLDLDLSDLEPAK
jgi:hypothetical protein